MDVFATYWQRLTRSSDGMMPGFLVEEGRGMEELVIVSISLILLTESLDRKQATALSISTMFTFLLYRSCWRVFFSNLGRKWIIPEERFVLERRTSRAMLATARSSYIS